MDRFNQKEFKGALMFLGTIGIVYTLVLILIAVITGAKIMKSIMIIGMISTMLFSYGVQTQTFSRMKRIYQSSRL